MHNTNMEPKPQNRPVYLNQTLMHFKIKSLADNSGFQTYFRARSGKIPPKKRITLEKMITPNVQEKSTPQFLEEYGT
jgi:hypothetical protein